MAHDLVQRDDGPVRWLVIDRPNTRNALTLDTVDALAESLEAAAADDSVRAVVLAGTGGPFCAGLDLKAAMTSGLMDPASGLARFHRLARGLRNVLKPTSAAIDGAAAGFGADLAMGCDLRLGTSRASLGERFVRIGLMPDGGGTFLLPRLVGTGRAFDILYSGRMVEADEMARIGLLDALLPVEGFEAAVAERAAQLAAGPPLSYARLKAALLASQGDFEAALAAEGRGQLDLLTSSDFMEGINAFLARREPAFQGR